MKQTDIDRLVDIKRVEWPKLDVRSKELKKDKQALDGEWNHLEKTAVAKLGREQIKVWETSNGVLVEVRAREKTVTILDKESYDEKE